MRPTLFTASPVVRPLLAEREVLPQVNGCRDTPVQNLRRTCRSSVFDTHRNLDFRCSVSTCQRRNQTESRSVCSLLHELHYATMNSTFRYLDHVAKSNYYFRYKAIGSCQVAMQVAACMARSGTLPISWSLLPNMGVISICECRMSAAGVPLLDSSQPHAHR